MDEHSSTEIIFEEEKNEKNTQEHSNTPEISFPTEDLVDILTDESWLTLGHDRRNSRRTRGHISHTP